MYNRYIPNANGEYQIQRVQEQCPETPSQPTQPCQEEPPSCKEPSKPQRQLSFPGIDLGDLLVLCILVLICLDNGEEDLQSVLIAAAAFLFLQ